MFVPPKSLIIPHSPLQDFLLSPPLFTPYSSKVVPCSCFLFHSLADPVRWLPSRLHQLSLHNRTMPHLSPNLQPPTAKRSSLYGCVTTTESIPFPHSENQHHQQSCSIQKQKNYLGLLPWFISHFQANTKLRFHPPKYSPGISPSQTLKLRSSFAMLSNCSLSAYSLLHTEASRRLILRNSDHSVCSAPSVDSDHIYNIVWCLNVLLPTPTPGTVSVLLTAVSSEPHHSFWGRVGVTDTNKCMFV